MLRERDGSIFRNWWLFIMPVCIPLWLQLSSLLLSTGSIVADNAAVAGWNASFELDKAKTEVEAETSQHPTLSPISPQNTLISIIHMRRMNINVQRLVCSLRARGDWHAPVMVLVDTEELVNPYDSLFNSYCGGTESPVYAIQVNETDLYPRDASGELIVYRGPTKMPAKRFKTLLWDYVDFLPHPLRNDIEYLLYVDEDNLAGSPLQDYLDILYNRMVHSTGLGGSMEANNTLPVSRKATPNPRLDMNVTRSFIGVYPQVEVERLGQYHTGLMLLHKHYSKYCLDKWRERIDIFGLNETSDQILLRDIPAVTAKKCDFQHIDSKGLFFPGKAHVRKHIFTTFVHLTGYRMKRFKNKTEVQDYLLDILQLNQSSPMVEVMFGSAEDSLL